MRRQITAWALALAMLAPANARTGEVSESITNPNVAGPGIYVYDGTRFRKVKGTSDGAAYTTELYPDAYQTSSVVIVSAVSLDGPVANTSTPLLPTGLTQYDASSIHGYKWARILVTGTAADSVNGVWSVRFYGSMNGTNFAPIIRGWDRGEQFQQYGALLPSTADTLKIRGRGPMATYGGGSGVQGM